jgi:hypothetical protein
MAKQHMSASILAVALSLHAGSSLAGFPDVMIEWMQGPPMLNGQPTYTAVHAESRIKDFDPQATQKVGALDKATDWHSVVPDLQPFRSMADRDNGMVYFRKDFFDKCPSSTGCNFYGEIFGFNDQFVYLRTESFPVFGQTIDDGKTWDIRIDKFRVMSNSNQGRDHFPGGFGRIWAPVHVLNGWKIGQTFDTLACLSFDAFVSGACQVYQRNFVDNSVSLEIWSNFSTVFDGEAAGYSADAEYKNFDRAIVISQIMGNGQARERFFLAGNIDNATGAFQSYGFVRWDNSVKDASGKFVPISRTIGLRRATDKQVSFDGMRIRSAVDLFNGAAGLRIFHDDAAEYPNEQQTKPCPGALESVGSIHVPPMTLTAGKRELQDLSGASTNSGGWLGVCYAPSKTDVELTLPEGCPVMQRRGSIFVKEANVKKALADAQATLVAVADNWVVLCAAKQTDWNAYFSLARKGCDAGGTVAGSVRAYKDCYDAKGRRCQIEAEPDVMTLCTTK